MVVAGRRKSIGFFITLGVGLVLVILLLYVGWVVLGWRTGILLFLGVLLVLVVISGVVINTFFLVREIRRNEQQDAFINAVTHELKTPVASIRLYLETLQTRAVDDTKRREFYRIMLEDSDRLLETIEQVLRTGRIGHSSRKPNLERIDLIALAQDCIDRARAIFNVPDESLTFVTDSRVTVMADLDEVRAAIFNLIDNAVKYSGKNVQVNVQIAANDEGFAKISVRDRGVGLPKSELKQVFKRFYRSPGTGAARVPGTGLGLYIVRSVAKRHGGKAWAESEGPGKGSTFVLQLPLAS